MRRNCSTCRRSGVWQEGECIDSWCDDNYSHWESPRSEDLLAVLGRHGVLDWLKLMKCDGPAVAPEKLWTADAEGCTVAQTVPMFGEPPAVAPEKLTLEDAVWIALGNQHTTKLHLAEDILSGRVKTPTRDDIRELCREFLRLRASSEQLMMVDGWLLNRLPDKWLNRFEKAAKRIRRKWCKDESNLEAVKLMERRP